MTDTKNIGDKKCLYGPSRPVVLSKQLARELSSGTIETEFIAPVAQLDRAIGFEPIGRGFESLRARHFSLDVLVT